MFQFLETICSIVFKTPPYFDLFLFLFVCYDLEMKYLQCQPFKCYENLGWYPAYSEFIVP